MCLLFQSSCEAQSSCVCGPQAQKACPRLLSCCIFKRGGVQKQQAENHAERKFSYMTDLLTCLVFGIRDIHKHIDCRKRNNITIHTLRPGLGRSLFFLLDAGYPAGLSGMPFRMSGRIIRHALPDIAEYLAFISG